MPASKNPNWQMPSRDRDMRFNAKYMETGKSIEAYRYIGLGSGSYFADAAGASRMLRGVKKEINIIRKHLESTTMATLKEKQAMLTEMALTNYKGGEDGEGDRYLALGAIRELNRMQGDYAPTKTQKAIEHVHFVQDFGDKKPAEKPVPGEVLDDPED